MGRVRFSPEQIIGKLREAELLLGQGANVGEAIRKLGVSEQTYYRRRKEYGGMRVDQARRLKDLDKISSGGLIKPASFGIKAAVMGAVLLILSEVVNLNQDDRRSQLSG